MGRDPYGRVKMMDKNVFVSTVAGKSRVVYRTLDLARDADAG